MAKDITELYHFTTFDALDGILTNKEIWLGNLKYMNDRQEMNHLITLIKEALLDDLPDKKAQITELFDTQMQRFKGKTAYAFSLSTLFDDAGQWDRYSNGGKGVCIKFNTNKLKEAIGNKASLQEVFYDTNAKRHQAKALIESYILDLDLHGQFKTVDELFENVWYSAIAHKHPSFISESEIRICAWPFLMNCKVGDFKYLTNRNGLREYYPIALGNKIERDIYEYIETIYLGPTSGVDKNLFFRYLQSKNNCSDKIEIIESKCPLR